MNGDQAVGITIAVLVLGYTLVSIVITLLKGKIGMALLGLLLHPVWWFSAWPLAKPRSPWARWFYDEAKLAAAWRAHPYHPVPPGQVRPGTDGPWSAPGPGEPTEERRRDR